MLAALGHQNIGRLQLQLQGWQSTPVSTVLTLDHTYPPCCPSLRERLQQLIFNTAAAAAAAVTQLLGCSACEKHLEQAKQQQAWLWSGLLRPNTRYSAARSCTAAKHQCSYGWGCSVR
jgi:hypothetical protein